MLRSVIKERAEKCVVFFSFILMLQANVVDIFFRFVSLCFSFYNNSACLFSLFSTSPPAFLFWNLLCIFLNNFLHYFQCSFLSLVFLCLCRVASTLCLAPSVSASLLVFFLKNNKVWGCACACACVLRWLHGLDALAALGWLLVWSPGKLYDLFS